MTTCIMKIKRQSTRLVSVTVRSRQASLLWSTIRTARRTVLTMEFGSRRGLRLRKEKEKHRSGGRNRQPL